ncbi:MAG: hypothetical protein Ta2D_04410 [Rickettsiales bacterium]|nr:MAG: hypothetical protein Ta2D_04410 [Rickettsiales bacterium]
MILKNNELYRHSVTGFLSIPLVIWFLMSFYYVGSNPKMYLPLLFASPMNVMCAIMFVIVVLYHFSFELKYILKYRITLSKDIRYLLFVFYDIVSIIVGGTTILSILHLYFLSLTPTIA